MGLDQRLLLSLWVCARVWCVRVFVLVSVFCVIIRALKTTETLTPRGLTQPVASSPGPIIRRKESPSRFNP